MFLNTCGIRALGGVPAILSGITDALLRRGKGIIIYPSLTVTHCHMPSSCYPDCLDQQLLFLCSHYLRGDMTCASVGLNYLLRGACECYTVVKADIYEVYRMYTVRHVLAVQIHGCV